MKELLSAIKTQLQTDLAYVRDSDIFVTEDVDVTPSSIRFPAIGLKDGPVIRKEGMSSVIEYSMKVNLAVFVQLTKPEASVMGDISTGKKGLLDITSDIHISLDENLLDIDGMQDAFCESEGESELFGDEKTALQRKIITYEYIKEGVRP